MVAYSTTPDLSFYNLCGILRIGITGKDTTIQSISFSDNSGKELQGYVTMPEIPAQIHFRPTPDPSQKDIRIDCGQGVALDADTPVNFYLIVPARAYEKGFTIAVDREAVKSTQIAYTIERSRISTMEAFEFVPSGPLSLHLENTGPISISYKNKGDPASNVNWVLVQKSYLDYCVANNSDTSADEWLASFLENQAKAEIVGNDGTCLVTATQGFHFKNSRELMPATDYVLAAAYYNGILHGEIVQQSVRTADAEGTAPELMISPLPVERPWASVRFVLKTEDAIAAGYTFPMSVAQYNEALLSFYSNDDEVYENCVPTALHEAELVQAGSAEGYQVGLPQLHSETDYIILAKAVGKGGKTTLMKHTFRTDGYLTDAVWKSAGTADLDCGLFTSIADPYTTTGGRSRKKWRAATFSALSIRSHWNGIRLWPKEDLPKPQAVPST